MINIPALAHRSCRLRPSWATIRMQRTIHFSPSVQKKIATNHDLFSDQQSDDTFLEDNDDLFPTDSPAVSVIPAGASTSTLPPTSSPSHAPRNNRRGLTPTARLIRFNEQCGWVSDRIGLKPVKKTPQVRQTVWVRLFQLAATKEQMEQVTEMFPRWTDSKRDFDPKTVDAFIQRCKELDCAPLALQVFSNRPKYRFDLHSLAAARALLKALYLRAPLTSSITLAALYRAYNLPPLYNDIVSCALLAAACLRTRSEDAMTIARDALLPALKEALEERVPMLRRVKKADKIGPKEEDWLRWALVRVEKGLKEENWEWEWLRKWRQRNGHIELTAY